MKGVSNKTQDEKIIKDFEAKHQRMVDKANTAAYLDHEGFFPEKRSLVNDWRNVKMEI